MDIIINQKSVKQRFRVKDNKVVYMSLEYDENLIEIHIKNDLKQMIEQLYKISVFKNNENLSYYLVVAMPNQKNIVSKLKT